MTIKKSDSKDQAEPAHGTFLPVTERIVGEPHINVEKILDDLAVSVAPRDRVGKLRRSLASVSYALPPKQGEGVWDFIRISSNLIISITQAVYTDRTCIYVPADDTFKVRILMRGQLTNEAGDAIVTSPGAYVEAFPGHSTSSYFIEKGPITLVVLHCRTPQLTDAMRLTAQELPAPLNCLLKEQSTTPQGDHVRLGPDVLRAANDILAASLHYSDDLLRAYIEAKSSEILCSILKQLRSPVEDSLGDLPLTVRDINRIYEARDILRNNFVDPPSITQLARKVAINQTKLKAAFKAVFGETLFGFIRRSRMERSMELLLGTDRTISEIAYEVGYEYPANFTYAFKRYHDFLPSDVERPTPNLSERT